ncbi:MAG: cytochrome c3 family protein [Gammaproteobacteria bacterium]|nr:cytochrome c3 family protein [Gammaproteobacteria bacterium]
MKWATFAILVAVVLLVWQGTPAPVAKPDIDHHWGSPQPILPMTFAHADHGAENCTTCHHDYIDDTGPGTCMNCHVTDAEVSPLLREQFHDLCMGCHVETRGEGEVAGPPRRCIDCHLGDDLP